MPAATASSSTPPDYVPIAVLSTRLDAFDRVLARIEQMVTAVMSQVQSIEQKEIGCSVLIGRRMETQEKLTENLDARLTKMERLMVSVEELLSIKTKLFVMAAVGGFLGMGLGGLILSYLFKAVMP
jgi:hypothetical protein